MRSLMASATLESNGTVLDHTKLRISGFPNNQEVLLMYSQDGVDFSAKSLRAVYQNGFLTEFTDGWFLLSVGSTQININQQQAIQIALDYAEKYSWTVNGTEITNFTILQSEASAQFVPHPRDEASLELIPYWYVTLPLDKVYPEQVNRIAVGIWADTGEVANIQTLS
jgi:hypothetical protein